MTNMSAVVIDPLGGLQLEPSNELRFKGPFDDYVTVSLSIRNPTEKRIAFKIKTTAPKRYCVKPNSGVLDSSQSMKVNVLLQPFTYDPNEKNKHKFMVQYIYLTDAEMLMSVNDILNMWKDVPASRLLDLKLKCLFDFTEAEQSRLNRLAPVSDTTLPHQPSSNSSTTTVSSSVAPGTDNTKQSASNAMHRQTSSSSAMTQSRVSQMSNVSNVSNASSVGDVFSHANDAQQNGDADLSKVNRSRLEQKDDNTLNELKMLKKENESLTLEVKRLKEEDARLRKLALSSPSRPAASAAAGNDLMDVFNNRLVLIVIVLIAIIVYLLLFR